MNTTQNKSEKKKKQWILPLLILLLLLLLFLIQGRLNHFAQEISKDSSKIALAKKVDSSKILDSIEKEKLNHISSSEQVDSVQLKSSSSSVAFISSHSSSKHLIRKNVNKSSSSHVPSLSKTLGDTLAPLPVFSLPEGMYYSTIQLQVSCPEKKCIVRVALNDSTKLQETKSASKVTATSVVYAQVVDSAGNISKLKSQKYQILSKSNRCLPGMVFIGKGKTGNCIDEYEWPNQLGENPKAFVSQNEAVQLCASVNKHLCSQQEWEFACVGPKHYRYPYGKSYDENSCTSTSTKASRSGRKKKCRSHYGVYDMAGNLWEWTSTPAKIPGRFEVIGGAWDGGVKASCKESRFSFYPQNQYPFVGFRCCSSPK